MTHGFESSLVVSHTLIGPKKMLKCLNRVYKHILFEKGGDMGFLRFLGHSLKSNDQMTKQEKTRCDEKR